jgi:hypothetical protein
MPSSITIVDGDYQYVDPPAPIIKSIVAESRASMPAAGQ